MKTVIVKDLMVPLEEYATVARDGNLFEAVLALEKVQMAFDPKKHKHRAVLVLDDSGQVVGRLTMFEILMALEPKYEELQASGVLSRLGYSPELIKSMLKDHVLWKGTMQFICSRASRSKVLDIMETIDERSFIDETDTLDEAIHQMVMCRYESLLVKKNEEVVGVLRLSDVFTKICDEIKTCEF